MNASFWMHIYASLVCKPLFSMSINGIVYLEKKKKLNLFDTNSPALPISLSFTEECAFVFMRNSHSLVHLQSVTAVLQQNKDFGTDSSLELPI